MSHNEATPAKDEYATAADIRPHDWLDDKISIELPMVSFLGGEGN